MRKGEKKLTTSSRALLAVLYAAHIHGRVNSMGNMRNAIFPHLAKAEAEARLTHLIYRLHRKGWIMFKSETNTEQLGLTKAGLLEALFTKAIIRDKSDWDGKWRLIIFDIPESARTIRDKLRRMLKQFGFIQLQASVYVSPAPLNNEGVEYLEEVGLMKYIRIARVDRFDNAKDLEKRFKL